MNIYMYACIYVNLDGTMSKTLSISISSALKCETWQCCLLPRSVGLEAAEIHQEERRLMTDRTCKVNPGMPAITFAISRVQ